MPAAAAPWRPVVAMPADISAHDMYGLDERCSGVGGGRFVSVGPKAHPLLAQLYVGGPKSGPNGHMAAGWSKTSWCSAYNLMSTCNSRKNISVLWPLGPGRSSLRVRSKLEQRGSVLGRGVREQGSGVCVLYACMRGSLTGSAVSHHSLYDDAAASSVVP